MQAAEREAARAAWEATPKRLRAGVLACCVCFRGVAMSVSVHEFPDRKGSAVFRFYAPLYAATMEIALSFTVIGTAIGLKKDDILSEWTDFEKMSYYRRVINKMSLTTSPDMVGAQRAKRRRRRGCCSLPRQWGHAKPHGVLCPLVSCLFSSNYLLTCV